MRIKPIVEGHGDVIAVPELIRRIAYAAGTNDIQVLQPIRSHRSDLVLPAKLERLIKLARLDTPDAILIVFDADEECPKSLAELVSGLAKGHAKPIPCEVVVPKCEYEAWFLGALESLRGIRGISNDAEHTTDPEEVRDAKGRVSSHMEGGRRYLETADQVALTAKFDMRLAYQRCRSFRRVISAMGQIHAEIGRPIQAWPPVDWEHQE